MLIFFVAAVLVDPPVLGPVTACRRPTRLAMMAICGAAAEAGRTVLYRLLFLPESRVSQSGHHRWSPDRFRLVTLAEPSPRRRRGRRDPGAVKYRCS